MLEKNLDNLRVQDKNSKFHTFGIIRSPGMIVVEYDDVLD